MTEETPAEAKARIRKAAEKSWRAAGRRADPVGDRIKANDYQAWIEIEHPRPNWVDFIRERRKCQ